MNKLDDIFPISENETFTDVIDDTKITTGTGLGSKVIVYNDNYHTFEQVINQLMKAVGCSEEVGFYHAMTIHTKGKSEVYKGELLDCIRVSDIIREINLKTQVVS